MCIPEEHRAALLKEFGKPFSIEFIRTPRPGDEQVLIKVLGAGICHTDVHVWKGDWVTAGIPPRLPFIVSHEIVGKIVACGNKVPPGICREGRKVLVYAWQYSLEDTYVIKGLTNLSDHPIHLGVIAEGGLQEYFLVNHYRFVVDIDGLEDLPSVAPLACAGLTTYRATRKILRYLEPDDYVAVVGLGGLGSYAIQWLKSLAPYVNIVGIDVRDEAIDFASKIVKLDFVVNPAKVDPIKTISEVTKGKGLKVVIDVVGMARTIGTYVHLVAKGGVYNIVGMMGTEFTVSPLLPFIVGEKTITSTIVGTLSDQHEVVDAARRNLINYKVVVSRKFKLDEVTEAFEALEKGKALGRQIVVFE